MLDPCCGSGHFLVAAFNLLVPLRMHDEGLTAEKACDAVLRDNLFGLELDPRCTQIAAFALALAAWKYPDAGGYRRLPPLNIACSGQGVVGSKADWIKFANGDKKFTAATGLPLRRVREGPDPGLAHQSPGHRRVDLSDRVCTVARLARPGACGRPRPRPIPIARPSAWRLKGSRWRPR